MVNGERSFKWDQLPKKTRVMAMFLAVAMCLGMMPNAFIYAETAQSDSEWLIPGGANVEKSTVIQTRISYYDTARDGKTIHRTAH